MRCIGGQLFLAVFAMGATSAAQPASDPDWPCVQRKTPRLSLAQMWSGPAIDSKMNWRQLPEVVEIAPTVAARRTSLDEAGGLIEEMLSDVGRRRQRRMHATALFAAVFENLEAIRRELVGGIGRYSREQKALANRIDVQRARIAALSDRTGDNDFDALDRIDEMQDALDWDVRAFAERAEALEYVCESPVLIEKRIFALAKLIQAHIR